jgi:heme exporter protein C
MAQRTQTSFERNPEFAATRSPGAGRTLWYLLLAAAIVTLANGFREAIFVAPTEATMGNVQRIFYYHVPTAMLSLVFPYINLAASITFLAMRHRNPLSALAADAVALASAEVTLVYTSIALATGMLWARATWGIWWTWDARLTTYLLLWLLYVSYLMTRRLSAAGQTSTLSAVLAVFAAVDIPIVYFSIQWWRTQHPSPVFGDGGSLDSSMLPAFLWNIAGWAMWGAVLMTFRYALERRQQLAEQDAALAAIESSLHSQDNFPDSGHLPKPRPPHAQ